MNWMQLTLLLNAHFPPALELSANLMQVAPLFQIKVLSRKINGITLAMYLIKTTVLCSFKRLRIISQINGIH